MHSYAGEIRIHTHHQMANAKVCISQRRGLSGAPQAQLSTPDGEIKAGYAT
jgi:hypothetical protein